MDWIYTIILYPIIFIFPAYVANGAPVLFGKGAKPITKMKFNGKPLLGMHKTRRGLLAGIVAGIAMGFLESLVPGYGFMFAIGILESFGTHFGDLLGSFIKRQSAVKEGQPVLLLDQYPFLIYALIFAYPLGNFPSLYGVIFLFALTWVMHRITNVGAHRLKIKEVPW